jgi:N-acetyl-anhydromuramyl-L-alanine amidase AmpD
MLYQTPRYTHWRLLIGATGASLLLAAGVVGQVPPRDPATESPDEPGAIWAPAASTNFAQANRPAERPIQFVVIHDIEGPAESAVRWFQNPMAKVSAHYVVGGTNGARVWQQVKERDIGWHAGNSDINGRSIGIEHDGYAYRPGFFNQDLYEASARLVRSITARYQIPRDRQHIIAHAEVPHPTDPTKFGGRSAHTDPGPFWDWDYYMTLVRNDALLEQLAAPVIIHPGEKAQVSLSMTNTGDEPWPALPTARRDSGSGVVYVGVRPQQPFPLAASSPLYDAPTWTSPRFIGTPQAKAATPPGGSSSLSFTVAGPRALGALEEQLRLVRVSAAPRLPVPFGPTLTLRMLVEPWSLEVAPTGPGFAAPGWQPELQDGRTVLSQRFGGKRDQPVAPATWKVALPISGEWEIQARWEGKSGRARGAVYEIAAADGAQQVTVSQRKDAGWKSLGRFRFDGAKPQAMVTLSAEPNRSGTVVADGLRFVGPFPAETTPAERTSAR